MLSTVLLLLAAIALTTAYFVFGHKRPAVRLIVDPDSVPDVRESIPLLAGLTGAGVCRGNRVRIYQNGAMITALLEAIEHARTTVHFETFVWATGELEKEFLAIVSRKAQQGVTVRVLIDAVGGEKADEKRLQLARDAGVEIAKYRPIGSSALHRFNHRNHRKLLVVDNVKGYVFGHGIADEWRGDAEDAQHCRDTGIEIEGCAVNQLQSVFFNDWIASTGKVPSDPGCFPDIGEAGTAIVHVASSTGDSESSVALLYHLAFVLAEKEIIIQNPYFAPDPQIVDLLAETVKRGVEVHLMVPGKNTDSRLVRRAGCHLYDRLLRSGVKLYEFEPALLHQKVVIVDRVWSHVGSTNFDERSLALNAEIGVGILDTGVAEELRSAFLMDLKRSHAIRLEEWRKRRWYSRVLDWCVYQLNDQL